MNENHLSEEELQQIALLSNEDMPDHLQYCKDCLLQVKTYRQLFEDLASEEIPTLDIVNKDLIMNEILLGEALKNQPIPPYSNVPILVFSLIVIMLTASLWLLGGISEFVSSITSIIVITIGGVFLLIAARDAIESYNQRLQKLTNESLQH